MTPYGGGSRAAAHLVEAVDKPDTASEHVDMSPVAIFTSVAPLTEAGWHGDTGAQLPARSLQLCADRGPRDEPGCPGAVGKQ